MTGVDELVAFVRQQLDRQEAALIACRDHRAGLTPCVNVEGDGPEDYSPWDSCDIHIRLSNECEYGTNLDYGLAEVEAKRRIVDFFARDASVDLQALTGPLPQDAWNRVHAARQAVRLLAQPYAGRDGWREEWRA